MSLNSYSGQLGIRPLTNNYCCTAVWPRSIKIDIAFIMQQFTWPISKSQSTNVHAEIGLHRSTVGISSQRVLSEPQTLRRVEQYVP